MKNWKFGIGRDQGIKALKKELKKQGFEVDYPPDMSTVEYEVGAEIWVPMPEKATFEEMTNNFNKIRAITEKIAGQFGLTAVWGGPVSLENALYFICCGFRRKPITR
ncbi:MAG: hypothetical protein Q7R61_01990 [bacterium]|nr:hypothetical protein [bacterium]